MRGIGRTLHRLPAVRALLAGAVVLVTIVAPKAYGQSPTNANEMALAIPRLAPRGGTPDISLLHPLAPSDAARIRRIFALQARGDIAGAVRDTATLEATPAPGDPLLGGIVGHLTADRHLGPHTRTTVAELQAWLDRWPDLPDAPTMHDLLKIRLPRGAPVPPVPAVESLSRLPVSKPAPVPEETERAGTSLDRRPDLDRLVRTAARSDTAGAAAKAILRQRDLPPGYAALLRGEAGQVLFARNRDREAYEVAAPGARSCQQARAKGCVTVAAPGYWAGLAAWRMDRVEDARAMFELAGNAEIGSSSQRAAAAFWAARAHLRLRNPAGYYRWMARAAGERGTFYGLIARRALGMGVEADVATRETLGEADLAAVAAHPAGLRAFALLQVGQHARAEAELRLLGPAVRISSGLARAVMLVAARAGFTDLAAQLADIVQTADGRPRERMRFPVPRLRPAGGFTVDPALVYAVARTESNFDPTVVSPAGARGLMQIMPATARFVAGKPGAPADRLQLHDPAVNLKLGQRYLNFLASTQTVGGDKLRLLASYNSGPTAFSRWGARIRDGGDPLLFIEAIPINETRAFVPRVLAYTWIYAARLGLPSPSLDELAEGEWPRYVALDTTPDAARITKPDIQARLN